jgi:hypothetical protein
MMQYAYGALAQYPKSEKFALVADIKKCMHRILEHEVEASKKYYKKTTLQELDVDVTILKYYIRLSHDLKFLPNKKYEIWAGMVTEIGRILGGWLKSVRTMGAGR